MTMTVSEAREIVAEYEKFQKLVKKKAGGLGMWPPAKFNYEKLELANAFLEGHALGRKEGRAEALEGAEVKGLVEAAGDYMRASVNERLWGFLEETRHGNWREEKFKAEQQRILAQQKFDSALSQFHQTTRSGANRGEAEGGKA